MTLIAGKTACDALKIERRNWMRWAYRPPAGERLLLGGRTKPLKAEYLAEKNNGFYANAGTEDEPIAAFEKTLECPMLSGHIGH